MAKRVQSSCKIYIKVFFGKKLHEKGMKVNLHLRELSKEKNMLIDNSRKNKAQHLYKSKVHLNKYDSKVLSNNFINEVSKVLHWQIDRGNSNANVEEFNFIDNLTAKKYDECNMMLKTIRSNNVNKLIFAHLNESSIRNKSEFLATQVKGKIHILMILETKTDERVSKGNF